MPTLPPSYGVTLHVYTTTWPDKRPAKITIKIDNTGESRPFPLLLTMTPEKASKLLTDLESCLNLAAEAVRKGDAAP